MKSTRSAASRNRRPALTAISTGANGGYSPSAANQNQHFTPDIDSMKALSVVSDNPFFNEDSEFDLMHIKITVFGLTGILVDKKEELSCKAKRDSGGEGSSASTVSEEMPPLGDTPVYAVITHKRNVTSSATSIASHLPSNPLENSMCSFGNSHRYAASWPAHNSSLLMSEHDECSPIDQSSLIMERVMMREPYDRLSNFVHETLHLEINLKRASEIIPLGVASLVISGDEEGALTMNIPTKPIRLKGKQIVVADTLSTKKKKKGFFSKHNLKPSFPSDKSVEYTLDENAALRISLQVVPHSSMKETEAAKIRRADAIRRKREQQKYREDVLRKKKQEAKLANNFLNDPKQSHSIAGCNPNTTTQPSKSNKNSSMGEFFCSPTICAGDDAEKPPKSLPNHKSNNRTPRSQSQSPQGDFSMDNSAVDSYLREHGIFDDSSVLSSVSESESESEEEERETLVAKSIVVRKRTYN
jgi:hypothetical protein